MNKFVRPSRHVSSPSCSCFLLDSKKSYSTAYLPILEDCIRSLPSEDPSRLMPLVLLIQSFCISQNPRKSLLLYSLLLNNPNDLVESQLDENDIEQLSASSLCSRYSIDPALPRCPISDSPQYVGGFSRREIIPDRAITFIKDRIIWLVEMKKICPLCAWTFLAGEDGDYRKVLLGWKATGYSSSVAA